MVEESKNMKCVEGKKYFNIVFHDKKADLEEKADCLVIFNGSRESLHAESSVDEIEVTKENLEQFSENRDELLKERKSENKSDPPIELLGDGLMNRKSVDLSSCKSSYAQQAEQLEVRFDENERRSLIISELKSGNTSPVIEGEIHERESPASGRSSKEPTKVKSIETFPSVSESRNSTCPSSHINNNSQKKSREYKSAGDICTESELKAHVKQTAKRAKNPKRYSGSTSYEDSDESIVSIAKIQSDKEPCSSDLGLSSLYSTIGTTEGTVSSAPYSDESAYTVLDPGLSISTNTYDIGSGNSRGRVPRPKARPDILVVDHPQQEVGRNRVPVFLRAEAVLQNGELEVVVKDERNSCPNNVNIKVTVLHGPAKKRTSSKFSAYKVVPRLPRAPAVDRDIVKHRAMRPPFNTHVNPEAAERHRRHFGLE